MFRGLQNDCVRHDSESREKYMPIKTYGHIAMTYIESDAVSVRNTQSSIVVHLIEQDITLRANIARRLLGLGFHAEIYAGIQEFVEFAPNDGVILINDSNHPEGLIGMGVALEKVATVMPIVVYSDNPSIAVVVAAMKARAVNYLSLEAPDTALSAAIESAYREGEQKRSFLTQVASCGRLIEHLSPREKQILELLVDGQSNKGMARTLGLSPRTVEIHRMKLMGKLGAKSPAQAVKIWCAANLAG